MVRTTVPGRPCDARGCVLTRLVSCADVQRGPGGERVAQSEPAAAAEVARRRQCRLRRADRRGEAAAPGSERLGSSSSGSTSSLRRQRAAAAAAAGERVRERASWVGEGWRPRHEAKTRGERPRPPRARALATPSSRGRPRLPASPPPPAVPVARGFLRSPLPHGNGARRRLL